MPVVPATQEAAQEDHLSPGITGQSGQSQKEPSSRKQNKAKSATNIQLLVLIFFLSPKAFL
jgi:hypothetical protein